MREIVYDCEILKIPGFKGEKDPNYSYCEGWRDFENLGISVIGCWVSENLSFTTGLHSFTNFDNSIPGDFPTFNQFLEENPLIIGFNTKQFDDKLCQANKIKIKTHYDLLEEIRRAAYGSSKWNKQPKGYDYNLDAIALANGMAKTGSGSLAPQLWQQGKRQEVVDYCLNDVRITYDLLQLGLKGELIDPNTQKPLKLRTLA